MEYSGEDIVNEHRKALIMSGNLSDFQLENLKKWPYILFEDIDKIELECDFQKVNSMGQEEVCAGSVTFDFYFKDGTVIDEEMKDERLTYLMLWTKFLFWQDTEVGFKLRGKRWS